MNWHTVARRAADASARGGRSMNRVAVRLVLASLAGIISAGAAQAQSADARWPERPIRFIVPFTAGSSSDTVARLVAQKLGERLGQQLVVENRVGGGGSLGTAEGARAAAGGYGLGLAHTRPHAGGPRLATTP